MRVATSTYPSTLVDQLGKLTSRQYDLQSQITTGQRVTNPDDDPAALGRVMQYQTQSKSAAQYKKNIVLLQEQAGVGYSAIQSLKKVSDRASEIATMADGTKSPDQLKIYAAEVIQLIQQAVQTANTKQNGEYIFGGTATQQNPFQATLDDQGSVTQVVFQGNTSVRQVEIDQGETVAVFSPGANTTGTGARGVLADSREGADFFQHLIDLQNHLQTGNTGAIAKTDQPNLSKDEENLLFHISANGALQARLEAASTTMTERASGLEKTVSKEADADIAETIIRLTQTQNAYKAALQSGASLLNQSLLDYLR